MQAQWEFCTPIFPKKLIDGARSWGVDIKLIDGRTSEGVLVRQRMAGRWVYRLPSEAEREFWQSTAAS